MTCTTTMDDGGRLSEGDGSRRLSVRHLASLAVPPLSVVHSGDVVMRSSREMWGSASPHKSQIAYAPFLIFFSRINIRFSVTEQTLRSSKFHRIFFEISNRSHIHSRDSIRLSLGKLNLLQYEQATKCTSTFIPIFIYNIGLFWSPIAMDEQK